MTHRDMCEHFILWQTNSKAHLLSILLRLKHPVPRLSACQYTLGNYVASTHRLILIPSEPLTATHIHYISRNESVLPHQSFVRRTILLDDLMPIIRNNLYAFVQRCSSSSNVFIRSLQLSDAFYKSLFFSQY